MNGDKEKQRGVTEQGTGQIIKKRQLCFRNKESVIDSMLPWPCHSGSMWYSCMEGKEACREDDWTQLLTEDALELRDDILQWSSGLLGCTAQPGPALLQVALCWRWSRGWDSIVCLLERIFQKNEWAVLNVSFWCMTLNGDSGENQRHPESSPFVLFMKASFLPFLYVIVLSSI